MSERPLECSKCKKKICYHYKELSREKTVEFEACVSCPVLNHKLHGKPLETGSNKTQAPIEICPNCKTTLEDIQRDLIVGCAECYQVFAETIYSTLSENGYLPPKTLPTQGPWHVGFTPFEGRDSDSIQQIKDLQKSLKEALKKENYEEAAWLRDKMNHLKEST